jgi:hypothetical protein
MQINDYLKVDFGIDIQGVSTVTTIFYQATGGGLTDPLSTILSNLVTLFAESLDGAMAPDASLGNVKLTNLDRTEQVVISPNRTFVGGTQSHPQHQCVYVHSYGRDGEPDKWHRNSNKISGVDETASVRGRLVNATVFDQFLTFLRSPQDTGGPGGAILLSQVRKNVVAPVQPPVWVYYPAEITRVNPTFFSLKSRKYELSI